MKWAGLDTFRGRVLLFIALTCLSVGGFLWVSADTYGLGFPLDDAWIHQTYARNLAERGEWAFVPGQLSAGSTAPLWTGILTLGNILGVESKVWSYFLGGLLLAITAWFCGQWIALRGSNRWWWKVWVGVLIISEWHLVWAAVSGMEILALTLVVVLVLAWLESQKWSALGIGALIGLGVWIRPDALSLLLPVVWHTFFRHRHQLRQTIATLVTVGVGVAILIVPYLMFNRVLAGAWWPSTFYAKQAEYMVHRSAPLLFRLVDQFTSPLVGVGAVLVPGIIIASVLAISQGAWRKLAPIIWALSYMGMYAMLLPVNYQHGRYAMPVIPIVLVVGLEGLLISIWPVAERFFRRVISRVWLYTIPVLTFTFWLLGSRSYAQDVAIIETEMVAAARWLSVNTEAGALVAAHDIGALGYFGERPIVDMAGLISPEVIPILRDEAALSRLLDSRGAEYLMTFPGWYPWLVEQAYPIYSTSAPYSVKAGGENMVIYKWRQEGFAP